MILVQIKIELFPLLSAVYQSSAAKCVEKALLGCPAGGLERFQQVAAVSQSISASLGVCDAPKICVVSEAFECVNSYAAALSVFDRTQDTQALCL